MTESQIRYITDRALSKGVNKSEVVRQLLDKAMKKDAKRTN